jgi:hypothetical protein
MVAIAMMLPALCQGILRRHHALVLQNEGIGAEVHLDEAVSQHLAVKPISR